MNACEYLFKEISLKTVVHSEDGNIRPAIDIFGYAISYLRNHVLGVLDKLVAK